MGVTIMQWLSNKEVSTLTGYKHHQKQVEALEQMRVVHTVRPDGSPVVFVNDLSCDKTTAISGTSTFVIDKGRNYG